MPFGVVGGALGSYVGGTALGLGAIGSTVGGIAGSALGSAIGGGGSSGGGSSPSGYTPQTAQTTSSTQPWSGVVPYLTGGTTNTSAYGPDTAISNGSQVFGSGGNYLGRYGIDPGSMSVGEIAPTWGVQRVVDQNGNVIWGSALPAGQQSTSQGVLPNAYNWYQSSNPQYYPNSTVAPYTDNTNLYNTMMYNRATQGSPLTSGASNVYQGLINGQYVNPAQAQFGNVASGAYINPGISQANGVFQNAQNNPSNDFYTQIQNGQNPQNPAMNYFQGVTNGNYLNANPYVDAMYNQAANQVSKQFTNNVLPGLASQYAMGGRYGPNASLGAGMDAATQQYGNTLNNLATSIYGQNYANERNLQQSGAQQYGALNQQALANQFQGAAGLSNNFQNMSENQLHAIQASGNLWNQDLQNQMDAMKNYGNTWQQGVNNQYQAATNAPAMAQTQYYDINQLGNLAQQQQSYQQSLLNDQVARYNYGQNQPLQKLQAYSNIVQGIPSYNSSTGTNSQQTPYYTNNTSSLLGAATLGNQLLNQFDSSGSQPNVSNADLSAYGYGGYTPTSSGSFDYGANNFNNYGDWGSIGGFYGSF